jgi:outer membrane protein
MHASPLPAGLVRVLVALAVTAMGVGAGTSVRAQQKIGYVDTEYVLNQMPEYETVQQKLDKLEQQWRTEIEKQRKEVQKLEQEFEARELLYTDEERKRKRQEIESARKKVEQLRQQYFGPEGQLYTRQQELMRPIQERVLEAAESVATTDGYDYVVEKKGDALFLYAREEHDLSDRVLRELGINVEQQQTGQR